MIADRNGKRLPVALSVAGSDSGAGAGVQADLLTFSGCEVFGTSAISALTAQNPDGVTDVHPTPPTNLAQQISQVMDFFEVKGVKTGMLPSEEIVNVVRDCLAETREISLVVDPVLAATSGSKLAGDCAFEAMKSQLFPRATLVTPNLDETDALTGERPNNVDELIEAAKILVEKFQTSFLLKGGHMDGENVYDILAQKDGSLKTFSSPRVNNVDTHGSGCTLSAAITAYLARGEGLVEAVLQGREYLLKGLKNPLQVGGRLFIKHN